MRDFTNIMYAAHGTADETEGLKQALSLARNNGAPLRVLVVCPPLPQGAGDYQKKYEESLLEQANASVASTRDALGMDPDSCEVTVDLVADDKPAVRIIQEVLKGAHDLLVKEADVPERGKGFWAVDMQLLRKCPKPVWLSRPIERHRQDIKVAVAVDPQSENASARALSVRMLKMASSLADDCSGHLDIVACSSFGHEGFLRNNPWGKATQQQIDETVSQAVADREESLGSLIEDAGLSGDHEIHHLRGEPVDRIPTFAEESSIDILVMGTVARTGIPGFLIGNTAENVVQSLSCSLIALKPADFVSPVKLS